MTVPLAATLLLAACAAPSPSGAELTQAVVTRHIDGDTARFRLESGLEEKVRFIGIDTPESTREVEPLGREASAYTAEALPIGATVWLEPDIEPRDRYGRMLAYVWLEEPETRAEGEVRTRMLNGRLLLDGYAQVYTFPPNIRYVDTFTRIQAEARDAGRGLWAE
jgi:micrococcal nuclease